ncbi:microcephalin isoform X3 [Gymnodraco acuticeps]|uniref:Microcephalin isoform X3 n=1 Tax=Gymnodraco acuticeps TaxID=8218 RepID=A0A6P8TJD4_GYMAC|nr:microcephalin isoform X3 [Gymnodraco acuticeps]
MTTGNDSSVLKDVVAYVDVWSSDKTANYSKPFVQQLQEMGAEIPKTFNKQVTHVVFNNGHPATWRNAKKSDVRLVSVLWVGRCYDDGVRADETLYPAFHDESNPVLKNKKHRSMQPKDSPERTPENNTRMKKKLDKMMKDIVTRQPLEIDYSPIIIDQENGIFYSPALKRSDYMAQRLKDMKEKRENISPTASQMGESCPPSGLKPSLGSTPAVFKFKYIGRGNERTVAAVLTKIPPEDKEETHNEQVSLSVQNMVNNTKAMRTLVMTSMPTENQQTLAQVVGTLGGFLIVDRVSESTTHVVSGGHRRTLNILLGIARGCWILSFEWILWCLEQRQWIPEEPYELSEKFPAAQICRLQRHLSAGEHQQDLFQDQPAMFVSQHSQPPTQSLEELIELCGGTVCKTVRQAGICIGKYNGRKPEGSRVLSEQWVLDSIMHLKRLSYDNYDLE